MTVASASFLVFATLFLCAFHFTHGWVRSHVVLTVGNFIFLWLAAGNLLAVGMFILFVLAIWSASIVVVRWTTPLALCMVLVGIVFLFGVLKRYEFLSFLPLVDRLPAMLGLSYALIRALQLIIDLREGVIQRPGLLTLFNYLILWPSLISGPIQRYQDFRSQQIAMGSFKLEAATVDEALRRIAIGVCFILIFAQMFKIQWINFLPLVQEGRAPLALAGAQITFMFYLFFDFAGYTHVAIGVGLLIGLRLPENFDRPWLATSFLDFWMRWHLSLSNWLRTYVFNSLMKALLLRWSSPRAAPALGVLAFFVTFFVTGLWHGTTIAFVICGLLFGGAASINQIYRILMRKWLGKARLAALNADVRYRLASAVIGLSFVCFSVTPLWMAFSDLVQSSTNLGLSGIAISTVALVSMGAIIVPVLRWMATWRIPRLFFVPARLSTAFQVGFAIVAVDLFTFIFPTPGGQLFYGQF